MSQSAKFLRDVWVLTARNEGFEDRYLVGVYTSDDLADEDRQRLGSQIENTRINKIEMFERNKG